MFLNCVLKLLKIFILQIDAIHACSAIQISISLIISKNL